jgi:predicted amidohydrolase YtcJ
LSDAAERPHADLIIVDRDPLACVPDDLAAMRVLCAVVGARMVLETDL